MRLDGMLYAAVHSNSVHVEGGCLPFSGAHRVSTLVGVHGGRGTTMVRTEYRFSPSAEMGARLSMTSSGLAALGLGKGERTMYSTCAYSVQAPCRTYSMQVVPSSPPNEATI